MNLNTIVDWLNARLNLQDFSGDRSLNGLQIGGNWEVRKVAFALDARISAIREAIKEGCGLLVVHHGLFWGKPFPITGPMFDLVEACAANRLALYAAHLPLDVQHDFGVNAEWCKRLNLHSLAPFTEIWGSPIGVVGHLKEPTEATTLALLVADSTKQPVLLRPHGPKRVHKIAVLGGSIGPGEIQEAAAMDVDLLLTGEQSLPVDIEAELSRINVLFAGHTASELPGIEGLKAVVEKELKLDSILIHRPSGL